MTSDLNFSSWAFITKQRKFDFLILHSIGWFLFAAIYIYPEYLFVFHPEVIEVSELKWIVRFRNHHNDHELT